MKVNHFPSSQALFAFSIVNYKHITYHNGQYEYPSWAHGIGWSIVAISLMFIPCYAIVVLTRTEGNSFAEVRF